MEIRNFDRRRFKRYPVNGSLLFSDSQSLVGYARVLDISDAGIGCISLSPVTYLKRIIDGVELYDPSIDMSLDNLRGEMRRCLIHKHIPGELSTAVCYFFGFEFSPDCVSCISRLKEIYFEEKLSEITDK